MRECSLPTSQCICRHLRFRTAYVDVNFTLCIITLCKLRHHDVFQISAETNLVKMIINLSTEKCLLPDGAAAHGLLGSFVST